MKASARLHFRDLNSKDASALLEIYSDAEAMKFRANPPLSNIEEALKMVEQAEKESLEFTYKRWAVVKKSDNELIGTLVFHYHKQNNTCTIGYSIGRQFWKKGYGQELLKAMIATLRTTNCIEVNALVHTQNLASICILEKQQFQQKEANLLDKLLTYSLNLQP